MDRGYQNQLRETLGLDKVKLNNMANIKELIDEFNVSLLKVHNEQILSSEEHKNQYLQHQGNLNPLTFDGIINQIISVIEKQFKTNVNVHSKNLIILSFIKSIGFHSDEKVDKRVNEFYDSCHSLYPCKLFVSSDKRLLDFNKARGVNAVNAQEFIECYSKICEAG